MLPSRPVSIETAIKSYKKGQGFLSVCVQMFRAAEYPVQLTNLKKTSFSTNLNTTEFTAFCPH